MKEYTKPWQSYEEQLEQLISRGLEVTDHAKALEHLARIGYYRLSGYWFPFREREGSQVTDQFKTGASFENAVNLYVFDKQLRLSAMDALERIEISLRVDVSHTLGKIDPFAYLKPEFLHENFTEKLDQKRGITKHHAWLNKHAQLISRSKEKFVSHNKNQYGLPLAIWVACEVWDFDCLSKLYSGMRETEQDAISQKYGIHNGRTFASWLRALNYLRNVCAHHSRLWNRNVTDQPKLPPATEQGWVEPFENSGHLRARCFLLIRIARHLLLAINPNSEWPDRMKDHLLSFPDLDHLELNLAGMGVPEQWEEQW